MRIIETRQGAVRFARECVAGLRVEYGELVDAGIDISAEVARIREHYRSNTPRPFHGAFEEQLGVMRLAHYALPVPDSGLPFEEPVAPPRDRGSRSTLIFVAVVVTVAVLAFVWLSLLRR